MDEQPKMRKPRKKKERPVLIIEKKEVIISFD